MKTIPVMWTNNKIIIGIDKTTHSDMISDLEIHKIKYIKELWNMGRCTEDFNTLYYYSFSELNNTNLNRIFKNFIQQDL